MSAKAVPCAAVARSMREKPRMNHTPTVLDPGRKGNAFHDVKTGKLHVRAKYIKSILKSYICNSILALSNTFAYSTKSTQCSSLPFNASMQSSFMTLRKRHCSFRACQPSKRRFMPIKQFGRMSIAFYSVVYFLPYSSEPWTPSSLSLYESKFLRLGLALAPPLTR